MVPKPIFYYPWKILNSRLLSLDLKTNEVIPLQIILQNLKKIVHILTNQLEFTSISKRSPWQMNGGVFHISNGLTLDHNVMDN